MNYTKTFPKPIPIANDGRFREDVKVRLIGFERYYNEATECKLYLMQVQFLIQGSENWSDSKDFVTGMAYADWYPELHDMPRNPNSRYGRRGRPKRKSILALLDN